MDSHQVVRNIERRKKRLFVPYLYFISEVIAMWLALGLIQLEFHLQNWHVWAIFLFIVGIISSVIKTVHILQRQKDYE